MKAIFNETMTRPEAQRIFFNYVAEHKGENIDDVKAEYLKVSHKIIQRESQDHSKCMTSYQFM